MLSLNPRTFSEPSGSHDYPVLGHADGGRGRNRGGLVRRRRVARLCPSQGERRGRLTTSGRYALGINAYNSNALVITEWISIKP